MIRTHVLYSTAISHLIHVLSLLAGQPIELKDEYFEEVKPGLSSFADKPADVSLTHIFFITDFSPASN